jgi:probable rRNA maturation factor
MRNRQRLRALNIPLLRRVTRHLLENELGLNRYELGFHFVEPEEMAGVNEQFLQHEGSTDVITFDHGSSSARLHGEIFICVADAMKQAREFKTTWQSEVVRYVIHALLHLRGFDDLQPARRRVMKREENRLVQAAQAAFPVQELGRARNFKLQTSNSR